jgi:hypothetical protein
VGQRALNSQSQDNTGRTQHLGRPHGRLMICRQPTPLLQAQLYAQTNSQLQNPVTPSKLYETLHQALHSKTIKQHIMKKSNWPLAVFHLIHWEAQGWSFKKLTQNGKINTCKLLHALVSTNKQNNLYCGTTKKCPCCLTEEETITHILKCGRAEATEARDVAFQHLLTSLKQLGTPQPIIMTIHHGSSNWISDTEPSKVKALTRGSLRISDIYLTVAFTEQYHSIGWQHLFLGHLTHSREKAYMAYKGKQTSHTVALHWSSAVITSLWEYTHQIWHSCNQFLHGTEEDQATMILQALREEVKTLYTTFQHNSAMILSRHYHLFTRKSLDDRLSQPYDDIQCWLHSVAKACEDLQHQEDILRMESTQFFPKPPNESNSDTLSNTTASPTLDSPTLLTSSSVGASDTSEDTTYSLASTITYLSFPPSNQPPTSPSHIAPKMPPIIPDTTLTQQQC